MSGRLSRLQAAYVVARRDFTAILFSRSFFFFLLGPLFPLVVGAMAGGVGKHVADTAARPVLGVVMAQADAQRMIAARTTLGTQGGMNLPELRALRAVAHGEVVNGEAELARHDGKATAILSGSPEQPALYGPKDMIAAWRGPVSMIAAEAQGNGPQAYPRVAMAPARMTVSDGRQARIMTAQAGQTMLFLLTMLLAGMVLSNLVEEKGNKIIEVLAAAIPMDAVFLGKLFAMLAISWVGVLVWGISIGGLVLAMGQSLPQLAAPAVGWPLFLGLGVLYFSMGYLLLGSLFLAIGSMATTVREVQTLSMPVTMMQLMVFFLASYAMTQPGSPAELAAVAIPFSSPFAMLARAAQEPDLWTHALALAWQALSVVVFVHLGARLFRSRVMKSGPAGTGRTKRSLFARFRPARALV